MEQEKLRGSAQALPGMQLNSKINVFDFLFYIFTSLFVVSAFSLVILLWGRHCTLPAATNCEALYAIPFLAFSLTISVYCA